MPARNRQLHAATRLVIHSFTPRFAHCKFEMVWCPAGCQTFDAQLCRRLQIVPRTDHTYLKMSVTRMSNIYLRDTNGRLLHA